ncbi:MAG: IS110 family transposase, partial [Acidobacteria bacterium]|nr:IS110 family transposase [Acidobacteriota bacterium]
GKAVRKRGKGKARSTRTAQALRNAATALRISRTALGAQYRRIARSKGPGVAVFVTARKLATLVYRLLRFGQAYTHEGQKVGYQLVKTPAVNH